MKSLKVVYFDGVCNLCDGFVSFLIALKPSEDFKVASLQGDYAKENLAQSYREQLSSVVYQKEGSEYTESSAVIRVLVDIKWYFIFLWPLLAIPPFLRDGVYHWIAKNRYRFFGKKETCRLPSPKERDYFLS